MAEYEIVSQFTEDAYAKEDCICDRPVCRAKIRKGDPCFYVVTIEPGQPGRNVCAPCYSHYKKNPATSVRPTRRAEQLRPFASAQGSINDRSLLICVQFNSRSMQHNGNVSILYVRSPSANSHNNSNDQPSTCGGNASSHCRARHHDTYIMARPVMARLITVNWSTVAWARLDDSLLFSAS
jgi:hypothetical protein